MARGRTRDTTFQQTLQKHAKPYNPGRADSPEEVRGMPASEPSAFPEAILRIVQLWPGSSLHSLHCNLIASQANRTLIIVASRPVKAQDDTVRSGPTVGSLQAANKLNPEVFSTVTIHETLQKNPDKRPRKPTNRSKQVL